MLKSAAESLEFLIGRKRSVRQNRETKLPIEVSSNALRFFIVQASGSDSYDITPKI